MLFKKYSKFIKFQKFHFSEKFYKVTFSGLDKFYTTEKLKTVLSQLNELEVHRANKSTNKNYCHVDVSSDLNADDLRIKFEGMKILGKSVKVRIKELNEEIVEIMQKNYNNLNFNELDNDNYEESMNHVKQFIKNFYLKNLTDNPTHVKNLIDQIEGGNNWLDVMEYNRELFELEYKLQIITESTKKFSIKQITQNQTFLPIKTLTMMEGDSKLEKQNNEIKFIKKTFENIFERLGYASYNTMTNKGVFRNLQIKLIGDKLLVTIMVSMSELSDIDIRILLEAIKFEFKNQNNISFYLCTNEKIQGLVTNSSVFYFLTGKFQFLSDDEIKIFPFVSETCAPLYLKYINLEKIFNRNTFHIAIDFTSSFVPFSVLLKNNGVSINKFIFIKEKYNFSLYENTSRVNILDQEGLATISSSANDKNFKIFEKIEEVVENLENLNLKELIPDENLLVINLKNNLFSKRAKVDKILNKSKYHSIISHSLSQILDFLKNYSNSSKDFNLSPKVNKIIFIKDLKFEVKEVILALEINC